MTASCVGALSIQRKICQVGSHGSGSALRKFPSFVQGLSGLIIDRSLGYVKRPCAILVPSCLTIVQPSLHEVKTVEELSSSCSAWYNHVIKSTSCGRDAPTSVSAWVDVRDLALAHVIALEQEEAGGERISVSAGASKSWIAPLQYLTVDSRVVRMARLG